MPNRPVIIRAQTLLTPLIIYVDGYPRRSHKLATRTGGEPLEDGREVTDHAVAEPRMLVLTGIVSDFGGPHRPRTAWRVIEDLHQAEEPIAVVTEWRTYPEMLIARCEGIAQGRGLRFELELREVLRVQGAVGAVVPASALAGPAQDRSGEVTQGRVALGPARPLPLAVIEENTQAARVALLNRAGVI